MDVPQELLRNVLEVVSREVPREVPREVSRGVCKKGLSLIVIGSEVLKISSIYLLL